MTTFICPHHSDSEPPWMCACTQRTLESSSGLIEVLDLIIADLEREIRDTQRENRELRAALHGTTL